MEITPTPRDPRTTPTARPARPAAAEAARQSIWALAGGKGGVGRSLLAANLGVQVARSGRRVVLVDLDLQGSNLQTYLGFQRLPVSLTDLASGRVPLLSELACETPTSHLRLIGGLQKGDLRDDPVAFVRQVAEQFASLSAEQVIVDCGSGRAPATIATFAEASVGILVTSPEPAAIEAVYLFAEAHLRWCLTRALTAERMAAIQAKLRESGIDPGRTPFRNFMTRLATIDPAAREEVARVVRRTRLELLLNQVRGEADEEAAASLASGFRKCFGLNLHTAGIVEHDLSVLQSVQKRRSLSQQYPNSAATKGISRAATRLMAAATPGRDGDVEWEDLESIDHYRVLELVPKASPKEVQSAYQLLKKTYDPETTYLAPVIEAPGLRELQARIEAAYRALIFLESRATYDRQMMERGAFRPDQVRGLHGAAAGPGEATGAVALDAARVSPPQPPLEIAGGQAAPQPRETAVGETAAPDADARENAPLEGTGHEAAASVAVPPQAGDVGAPGSPSGGLAAEPRTLPEGGIELRQERERRKLTLEAIAEKTKIRPAHLQALEEERFGDLPAAVFVRGFLREYARCLNLPSDNVTQLYMKRYQDWHESRRQPPGAAGSRSGS